MNPEPPSDAPDQTRSISDVAQLAAALAERVIQAQLVGKPAPEEDIRLLMDAAMLLDECGEELPPLLIPIIQEVRAGRRSLATDNQQDGA
jgi:hypothetical protein